MASFSPFDLVVVPFPFTDRNSAKRRPALVLSTPAFHHDSGQVILAMITTAKRSAWESDVPLQDWRAAGLPHPSVIRAKIFTLDARFIVRPLGELSPDDRGRVSLTFAGIFSEALGRA